MNPVRLDLVQEIDQLWHPIYPYLAQHVHELYGRTDGDVVEIGPFCGVIFSLVRKKIGHSFFIAAFPEGMGNFFQQEGKRQKLGEKIEVLETNPSLDGLGENRFDLVIFRGAIFFPTLFQVDFSALYRIVKKGGMALLGGGFGKFTPESVIEKIKRRSRELNLMIGKTEIDKDQLVQDLQKSKAKGRFEFFSEGGLWVVMKK
jgi:hypothetical protein